MTVITSTLPTITNVVATDGQNELEDTNLT